MIHHLLEPLFQPIVGRDGQVYAYEALMRFRGSTASPARIVKRWEKSGFIKRADLAMLRVITDELIITPSKPRIAVNVSITTVETAGQDYIDALVNIAPYTKRLIVELTETAPVSKASLLIQFASVCRDNGVIIALDDCRPGHPYGSPIFINSLRPQILKIDGAYIEECFKLGSILGLKNLISMAHDIDAKVIAEYISSKELLDFMFYLGADFVQGFELGKPAKLCAI